MNPSLREIDFAEGGTAPTGREGVVEVPVLLALPQVEALEDAAARRGVTTGQLLRRLVGKFLREEGGSAGRDEGRVQA